MPPAGRGQKIPLAQRYAERARGADGQFLVSSSGFSSLISHYPSLITQLSKINLNPIKIFTPQGSVPTDHRIPDRTFGNIAEVANRRAPDAFNALQHPVGAYGAIPIGDKRRSRQLLPKSHECDHFRSNCNSASEAEYSRQFNCTTSPLQITQNFHVEVKAKADSCGEQKRKGF